MLEMEDIDVEMLRRWELGCLRDGVGGRDGVADGADGVGGRGEEGGC